jgi:hypothetical protein
VTRRPDLFIIGAAKCGTTSVYEWLKGHPEVFMSPAKEPRYFAPDLHSDHGHDLLYGRDRELYRRLFDGATNEKRLGEASVRYIYSRESPRLLRDFQPEPYIVAMIRDPVDAIYSMHHQRVSEGTEEINDFEEALAAENERRQRPRLTNELPPALTLYRDRGRFGEQLARWFDVFERERIHVIVFEDMIRDPAAEFRRLLQFIEVDPGYQPASFAAYNVSHAPRSRMLRDLLNVRAPRAALRAVLSQPTRDFLRQRLIRPVRRANRRPFKYPPMSAGLRARLEREFEPDVRLTSELLGRDLMALWFGRTST